MWDLNSGPHVNTASRVFGPCFHALYAYSSEGKVGHLMTFYRPQAAYDFV